MKRENVPLRILRHLMESPADYWSASELMLILGIPKSNIYRALEDLERYDMIVRLPSRAIALNPRLASVMLGKLGDIKKLKERANHGKS